MLKCLKPKNNQSLKRILLVLIKKKSVCLLRLMVSFMHSRWHCFKNMTYFIRLITHCGGILDLLNDKLEFLNPHQADVWESLIRRGGGLFCPPPIFAILLHSRQQKTYQETLGTLRWTLIGSRTQLRPSMDPKGPLKWTSKFSSLF